jgi:lysophospholipase L1-like esterase
MTTMPMRMKKALHVRAALALALVLAAAAVAAADGPTPFPTEPEAFPGRGVVRVFGWMKDNRQYFWKQRERDHGAIVFAGDSLTDHWKTLRADFPGRQVANRGIGGDVTRGLLFRWQEDVLDLEPPVIVLLIGTNDLSAKEPVSDAIANIGDMLARTHARLPATRVLLCTLPPRESAAAPIDPATRVALNREIASLARRSPGVTLIDLDSLLTGANGTFEASYFQDDHLHLAPPAYAVWRRAVAEALAQ